MQGVSAYTFSVLFQYLNGRDSSEGTGLWFHDGSNGAISELTKIAEKKGCVTKGNHINVTVTINPNCRIFVDALAQDSKFNYLDVQRALDILKEHPGDEMRNELKIK